MRQTVGDETMTYPKDILEAAERALDALLCNCPESCGGIAGVRQESIKDIAAAIATEREACAKIAEDLGAGFVEDGMSSAGRGAQEGAQRIAAAIRNRT